MKSLSRLTVLMPESLRASIGGSTAGHTTARLMQPQRLEWPDTAMAHIMAIALRTIPATTRRSRTRAIQARKSAQYLLPLSPNRESYYLAPFASVNSYDHRRG